MNVMLVSQCSKRALEETRRILDQFAERKGERTWQTAITLQGLATLRKMLRKTAKRNTAVACHWIKSANRTELLWIVGSTQEFNEQGTVPTNSTQQDILRSQHENNWHTAEDISLLAGIAGLFHDFGKANKLFQQKLKPTYSGNLSEPYRHDWLSLRMFQSFVGEMSDQQWLEKLSTISELDEQGLLEALTKDGLGMAGNPFKSLQPSLARTIGWLILSHHRLPKWDKTPDASNAPRLSQIDIWLVSNKFGPSWNSPQCCREEWTQKEKEAVWEFADGTPLRSKTWQAKAHTLATRALKRPGLISSDKDWISDTFSLHLARLLLMLSDHHYSAHEVTPGWQDKHYNAFANTDRETKKLKQKLDEHLVGVGHNSVLLAKRLPALRQTLPAITRHKSFKKRSENEHFRWQDKSYELACGLRERSAEHGFFGVNMASTGCGKTFANGRIMYGLANEILGCRFSIALGLRTLTLQTGDALRERLKLDDDDLAVLIGSLAVRQLHEFNNTYEKVRGSESAEDLFAENQYVRYEGTLDDGRLSQWLSQTPKLHQLVSAPILVSTIDHLTPATEGERGGKQIAPMLRLLTSDLVLDEPDDFDLADLPALSRLVNWAGVLGSRVLISSATLPPTLIRALFDAYTSGRRAFQKACGEPGRALNVCCAWFDEDSVAQSDHGELASFVDAHDRFVQKRVNKLVKAEPIRQAELLPVKADLPMTEEAVKAIANAVHGAMHGLHANHNQVHPDTGKRVSIGLVRMANINPLVAVAKQLLGTQSCSNHRIHYCVYHGQHPLAVRSAMEQRLDGALTRHDSQAIWRQPSIKQALAEYPEGNQLFVVLATSVAEVGRDHDYDWAIAEPSSMRSLIQLAGRIQRHRNQVPQTPNLLILSHNYRALIGKTIAFEKPGFESGQFPLNSHDLHDLLEKGQFQVINAISRILERNPLSANQNLADLEHVHLAARLIGSELPEVIDYAARWWQHAAHWSFELQRRTPFRQSAPDYEYVLYFEDEGETPEFNEADERGDLKLCEKAFERIVPEISHGVSLWGDNDIAKITVQLAESMDMEIDQASRRFGVLRLRKTDQRWLYNSALGVHGALD
jgi:CRISPR-associated endonuclease/helicase Cas3